MKKVARMLRAHEDVMLNYFRAKRHHSFGHRPFEVLKLIPYHNHRLLPEPLVHAISVDEA
jgi:hypothetical protein